MNRDVCGAEVFREVQDIDVDEPKRTSNYYAGIRFLNKSHCVCRISNQQNFVPLELIAFYEVLSVIFKLLFTSF